MNMKFGAYDYLLIKSSRFSVQRFNKFNGILVTKHCCPEFLNCGLCKFGEKCGQYNLFDIGTYI